MGLKINPDEVRLVIGGETIDPKTLPREMNIGKPLPSPIELVIQIGDADLRSYLNGRTVRIRAIEPKPSKVKICECGCVLAEHHFYGNRSHSSICRGFRPKKEP